MDPHAEDLVAERHAPDPAHRIGRPRRLHWGCGPETAPGWLNADQRPAPGVDLLGDLRDGLPLPDDSLDYIASHHALQEIPYLELVPALRELRRVLAPGGVLRLGLPDLDRAIAAFVANDPAYFNVKDDETPSVSGKFIVQMTWYGASRVMFNFEFAREMLQRAGFGEVRRCAFRQTASDFPEIASLDNRERETLFVEAVK